MQERRERKIASLREEIDEILVDAYGEYEQMAAWECAFTEEVALPLQASLLDVALQVREFRVSDANTLQCLVLRQQKQRWIAVEDLDDEGLPQEFLHLLTLYRAWLAGDY